MNQAAQNIIRQNTMKSWIYMGLLTSLMVILGNALANAFHCGSGVTSFILVVSLLINLGAYFFSHKLVIWLSKGKPLTKAMSPEIHGIVDALCRKAELPKPQLYYIETDAMNAFATGRSHNHAAIALTRGLIEKLNTNELSGVIAHELAHIQCLDMRLMAIVSVLGGMISIFADLFWHSRLVSKASEKDNSGIMSVISLLLSLIAPITAMFIQLGISQKREFVADALAVTLTQNPDGLITALEKLKRDHIPLPQMTQATAHLYFSNKTGSSSLVKRLFSTHPPISERIEKLRQLKDSSCQTRL